MQAAVVIPVKAFHAAKLRLAPALSPGERAMLAQQMAAQVVAAAGRLPVAVVCDDPVVRDWALDLGATVRWTPGLGLDGAVQAGVDAASADGADRIVVAHADLPMADDFDHVVGTEGIVIVPDRHRDGTNVITVPADSGFRFMYGPRSFTRHQAESVRLGLPLEVRPDEALGWDVDEPADLLLPDGADLTPTGPGRAGRPTR